MSGSTVKLVAELSVAADAVGLGMASAWLAKSGSEHEVPKDQIRRLDLCLNESIANIIAHGGPTAVETPVILEINLTRHSGAGELSLTVSDGGAPFDPLAHHAKPRPKNLEEAQPGGLGLMMMHEFSDSLDYRYVEGRNQTTFTIRWDEGA